MSVAGLAKIALTVVRFLPCLNTGSLPHLEHFTDAASVPRQSANTERYNRAKHVSDAGTAACSVCAAGGDTHER